jgi:hypothetical protein
MSKRKRQSNPSQRTEAMTNLNPTHVHAISPRGAPMGRQAKGDEPDEALHLQRVRINSQGYDTGGAYWGITTKSGPGYLYIAYSDTFTMYTRAWSREAAKREVLALHPHATFKR